jgi:hypothetical protein
MFGQAGLIPPLDASRQVFGHRGGTDRVKTGPERVLNAASSDHQKNYSDFLEKTLPSGASKRYLSDT